MDKGQVLTSDVQKKAGASDGCDWGCPFPRLCGNMWLTWTSWEPCWEENQTKYKNMPTCPSPLPHSCFSFWGPWSSGGHRESSSTWSLLTNCRCLEPGTGGGWPWGLLSQTFLFSRSPFSSFLNSFSSITFLVPSLPPTIHLPTPCQTLREGNHPLQSYPPQPLCPSSKEMAPAIDWLSCLQATFTPMPLSPSQLLLVHDLEYLKNMSQLVEEQLSNHRFASGGIGEV